MGLRVLRIPEDLRLVSTTNRRLFADFANYYFLRQSEALNAKYMLHQFHGLRWAEDEHNGHQITESDDAPN